MGHTKAQLLSNECTLYFVEIKAIKLHVEPEVLNVMQRWATVGWVAVWGWYSREQHGG